MPDNRTRDNSAPEPESSSVRGDAFWVTKDGVRFKNTARYVVVRVPVLDPSDPHSKMWQVHWLDDYGRWKELDAPFLTQNGAMTFAHDHARGVHG